MDLKRKLARLSPPSPTVAAPASGDAPTTTEPEGAVRDTLAHALTRRASRRRNPPDAPTPSLAGMDVDRWPFVTQTTDAGEVHTAVKKHPVDARHGAVLLSRALEVTGDAIATLALDSALAGFDPLRALYLDTETTGLAGGAGTLPFMVGVGWFQGRSFRLEQYLLADPGAEAGMMSAVAAHIARAQCVVTFNGKTFDLPLLRSRFVLSRVTPPSEVPHLDLLHVARRIYGARVERCTLTTLERDVLGFARTDDIPGAEVPERYRRYLRDGERAAILPVAEHNLWDVAALAALVGELGARAARASTEGRFEPRDLVGLARTTLRAGQPAQAAALAAEAGRAAAEAVDAMVARDAHVLAAHGHRRARDPASAAERLLDALSHAPDDPALHLALARCFERDLGAPDRALVHALRSVGAETTAAHARRVARLRRQVARGAHLQLSLPGILSPPRTSP